MFWLSRFDIRLALCVSLFICKIKVFRYGQLWHAKTFIVHGYCWVSNETSYRDNGKMLIKFIKNEKKKEKKTSKPMKK